jgi:hypothetical protein
MGSKNPIPTVTNWLKFPWEMKQLNAKPVSDEDIDDLLADINAANATK